MTQKRTFERLRRLRPISVLLTSCLACFATQAAEADLAIINARVLTGSPGGVIEDGTILISGESIESVSAAKNSVPVDALVIDAAGMTVLPGLIDSHVHLFFDLQDEPYFPTSDAEASRYVEESIREKLKSHLEHGFTTIISPIDFWPQIVEVRDRVASGQITGPRLFVGGGVFVAPGGHYVCRRQAEEERRWCNEHVSWVTADPHQAREGIRRYAETGIDFIVFDSSTNSPILARDVAEALVNEADRHDLSVLIHGSDAARFNGLIDAGVDGFVHPPGGMPEGEPAGRFDPRGGAGIPIAITIGETEEAIRRGERSREEIAAFEATRTNVLELLKHGAVPVFGSDMPGADPSDVLPIVLRSLVDLGLSNAEVVDASTRHPARALLGKQELGTIEKGSLADILIVNGDPLDDIMALREVAVVIKGGSVVVDKR